MFFRKVNYTLYNKVYHKRNDGKSDNIDKQKYGIRKGVVYHGEHGKRAIEIGADEEHIEGFIYTRGSEYVVHNNIKQYCHNSESGKNHYTVKEISKRKFLIISVSEEDAEDNLHSVVEHSLNIDADNVDQGILGIDQNRESCKKREECHKADKRITHSAILHKDYKRKHVER